MPLSTALCISNIVNTFLEPYLKVRLSNLPIQLLPLVWFLTGRLKSPQSHKHSSISSPEQFIHQVEIFSIFALSSCALWQKKILQTRFISFICFQIKSLCRLDCQHVASFIFDVPCMSLYPNKLWFVFQMKWNIT